MPLNPDLHKVMIIGSGPIVIGQAAEFDYAGSQACRALKDAGLEVVLVNPNPATIMTDHSSADHIYIEPLTLETLRRIILKEKPDSLLSTLGGQSGLTLSMQLAKEGFLEQHGVKLLGAKCETIEKAEDRQQFKDTMLSIHQPVIPSEVVETVEDALAFAQTIGYPVIVRPAYTLGGSGGGICQDEKELAEIAVKNDIMVISDEVYERLLYDDAKHISIASLPGMKERTITLNGFSKAYSMTGWRLGYAACNEEIVKTVNKLHQHVVTCATSFVQKAGVVALKEEKNEVTDMVKEYQRRRDYAVKAINEIDGLSCRCPKGAFYIFINIEKLGMTGQEFAPLLLENAKVALVPGDVFGTEGDHYVRMSFANSYENVVEGCKRLKEFVEKLRRNK